MFGNSNPFKSEDAPKELIQEEVYHATGNGVSAEKLNEAFDQKRELELNQTFELEKKVSGIMNALDHMDDVELAELQKRYSDWDGQGEDVEEELIQKALKEKFDRDKLSKKNQDTNGTKSPKRNPYGDNMKTMSPEKRERAASEILREIHHATETETEALFRQYDKPITWVPSKIESMLDELVERGELIPMEDNNDQDLRNAA